MIKNAVSSLMVRLRLPFAAPASTYHALLPLPLPRQRASTSASVPPAGSGGAAMSTTAQTVADQKRALRSDVRRALKALSPDQRTSEDLAIQGTILNSSWFKESKRLCAYISCAQLREVDTSKILAEVLSPNSEHDGQGKGLYVPRVEDKNRNMRMLKITTMDDLVKNSMNILEPSPLDASGNAREDVLSASSPVDLFLLPGQAFDRTGRRLGRGGGYYDTFLMKYQELAKEKGWSQPLLGMTLHIFRSLVVYICVHNFLSHNFTESFGILVYYICVKYTFGPSTLPLASFWSLYFKNRTKVNLFRVDSFEVEGPEWTVLKLMDQNEPMDGVALSYSVQIMEEGIIPVNSTDVPIDALVTSSGVIPFSPAAFDRM